MPSTNRSEMARHESTAEPVHASAASWDSRRWRIALLLGIVIVVLAGCGGNGRSTVKSVCRGVRLGDRTAPTIVIRGVPTGSG